MSLLIPGCRISVDDIQFLSFRRRGYLNNVQKWNERLPILALTQQFAQYNLVSIPHLLANLLFHQVYYWTVFSVHGQKSASQRVIVIDSAPLLQKVNDPETLQADGITLVTNPLLAKPAAKGHLSSPGQLCQKCVKEKCSCLLAEK